MERPSRDQIFMEIAAVISKRGTCGRAKVGCVITQENRIVSSGYNGPVSGAHCDTIGCDMEKKCEHAVHAEANAIAFAAREGIALDGATIYCMTEPCINCAMLIIQAGIKKVYFENLYTNSLGTMLMEKNGVEVKWINK
jgi:dCMP deaminase